MCRPDYTGSQLGQMRGFKVYAFGFPFHKGRTFLNQLHYYQLLKERKQHYEYLKLQGGSNMTGTDLCVNKPHCAAAVRP